MTQLRADQLAAHLQQSLAPVYFIHGDETLLVNECADAIRTTARAQHYSDRQVFSVEAGFDWNSLLAASDSLSLFAERRILELRLPGGKPGREGAQILQDYARRPAGDTLLLITSAKLEQAARRSKWVLALDQAGVSIAVRSVDIAGLPAWIERRMRARGMRAGREALELIAGRVEGNLLAAAQEIEKLYLLHGAGELDIDTVSELVADSARYDVFGLVDAALAGDAVHAQRILSGLRGEGVEPVLVLWALSREIRSLTAMARQLQGASLAQVLVSNKVWDKRKPQVTAALQRIRGRQWWQLLQRCAHLDRVTKGRAAGSAWDELLQLTLILAGLNVLKVSA
jgi:DNA polymerase III subunit delta